MGVEMIKDRQGKDHLVFSDEDFYNDDIMGNKFEDYEILQVFEPKQEKYGFVSKVRSKFNSKIYAMKKIDRQYASKIDENTVNQEIEIFKSMNSPNITRYFKHFYQDSCLYIISEYVNNRDLSGFLSAYSSLEKPIEINTLWNIFMQCISALKYIHSKNIIHKNISLFNIFMTENKIVKLGDFRLSPLAQIQELNKTNCPYQSPELKKNLIFTKKTDIYALGAVFHRLCYCTFPSTFGEIKNKNYYPKEMGDIIQMMINQDENARPDTEKLYSLIMEEYIKNVTRISSIDSIFRCMCSFKNFTNYMYNNIDTYSNSNMTPISFDFVNCLQNYFCGMTSENAIYLNNFRDLLYNNSQLNNEMEVKPSLALEYLLEKLNKETGTNYQGQSLGNQTIDFDQEKETAYKNFSDYFKKNFSSIISKYFVGFLKTKRICQICHQGIYSFNLFPFIEFDLDRCQDNLNLENWFDIQNNHCLNLSNAHNVVCQNCKCVTPHFEFKQFFKSPQNFIISLNRGEGFRNVSKVKYPEILNLEKKIEMVDSYDKFKLVGIVKRMLDTKGSEYYISVYYDDTQKSWVVFEKKKLTKINSPFEHKDGIEMILFYSAIITLGE